MTTQAPQGFFSGSNGLDASNRVAGLEPGFTGDVRVELCRGIHPRKGGQAFIVEFTVLTSNQPSVPVGVRRSWYNNINPAYLSTCMGPMVAFLYACLGLVPGRDQAVIDRDIKPNQDAWLNQSISSDQPLSGRIVHLETGSKPMKEDKTKLYTTYNFSAIVTSLPAAPSA